MSSSPSQIDILLRLVPDNPDRVLFTLSTNPSLALAADAHGYTLIHAAASYGHIDLIRTLVSEHKANINTGDEDGETPLFYAESVDVVISLVEEFGADITVTNDEGKSLTERWEEDGEGAWVAEAVAYIKAISSPASVSGTVDAPVTTNGAGLEPQVLLDTPAPLPDNVQINFGTMQELPAALGADPEIRRRIEELAQRGDMESEETQAELRALVTEVVTGMREDVEDGGRPQRRRIND